MNLLLTGAFGYSEEQKIKLRSLGCDIYFMQYETGELPLAAKDIDAVVCNGLFLYHDLEKFENLKFIQLTSAGLDRVPADRIYQKGIILKNARGVYSIPMAEWVMMRVLEHYKNLIFFAENQKAHSWNKCRNLKEVAGIKLAIVGAGSVGQEVAARFEAFGAFTVGFDVHTNSIPHFHEMHLIADFYNRIHDFDIIVLTAPYTPETYHMIGYRELLTMKNEAMVVNIARGQLIDENALVEALVTRTDLYVALDVFEQEPLPIDSPLWDMENVAISPHNSFVSNGNNARMFDLMYNNLNDFMNGN